MSQGNDNNVRPQLTPEQIKQLMALQQMMKGKGGAGPMAPPMTKKQMYIQGAFKKIIESMQRGIGHLDRFVNFVTKKTDEDRNDVVQAARAPILFGTFVTIIFIGFGGLWSALAPLDSAAPAIGFVISDTNRKIIQHEGGVIKNIFVKQGDKVKEGDKLIELEDSKIKANYESHLSQYRTWLATEARLIAERDLFDNIEFPEFLKKDEHIPEVHKIMRTQENLFRSKMDLYRSSKESLKQKIDQQHKQVEAAEAKKVATEKSLEFIKERLKAGRELHKKGYMQKAMLHELETKAAGAESELASVDIQIAASNLERTRAELELINTTNEFTTRTLTELREAQFQAATAKEAFTADSDALSKVVIRSPVDGIINKINYHTIGGVISHAQEILEITPINDNLIIEAKIPHKNIDSVHEGLVAKIKFSAFKARTTPLFKGVVESISPDTVPDKNQSMAGDPNAPYYYARIAIDMDEFEKVAKAKNIKLHPGMQAEVQIVTGTRTLLRYLLDPVIDTMFKAFKEK